MERISSPGWYSRTSSNSMPRPLKTLSYCPAKTSVTIRVVVISMRLILRNISAGIMPLWNFDLVKYPLHYIIRRLLLGLRLVARYDAVAQDVEAYRLHIVRSDVAAPLQEGVCL